MPNNNGDRHLNQVFEAAESMNPLASAFISLRGQLIREGMPTDVADEVVKSVAQMSAANMQERILRIQAAIMGVDLAHLDNEGEE